MDPLSLTLAAHVDRAALIADGEHMGYAELAARALRMAAALADEGVTAQSRVAVIAGNSVDTVVAIHALIELGATLVPIHPRLTPIEVDALLEDAAPDRVLREGEITAEAQRTQRREQEPLRPLRLCGSNSVDPETPLAMVYTSGTTGRPKGALLPRRAFVESASASARNLGWEPRDRWLLCMPLCHVGGLSILTRCLLARRTVILVPRFSPDAVLDAITREGATLLSVVPTMLEALLEHDVDGVMRRLRAMLVGGAAASGGLLEECARRSVPALTTYGLTEACSQVTCQRPRDPFSIEPGSGAPLPGVELIITSDHGDQLPPGASGRIRIRGPTLMSGYFRGPDCPLDPAVDAEGFFDTGDLGALDDAGRLHVHARRTDLIVTGGENVYPVEVEEGLSTIPGVRRALVFGVPDARWGQVVACALEIDPAHPLRAEALFELLAARLAPHKRPRLFCAVDALPLTGSGKLDRARAAERYEGRLALLSRPGRGRG